MASIDSRRLDAAVESAYASAISYTEALVGISKDSTSWPIIKLYYSCFYGIKSLLLMNNVVPFNGGDEMMLDLATGSFFKGGRSSHHWNWASIGKTSAKMSWFFSQDSHDAYDIIRGHRENVNYTHGFIDPELHSSLVFPRTDIQKRFRAYRDDSEFLYTYLPDHLTLAYPTRMLTEVDAQMRANGLAISTEQSKHLASLWKFKDRCLLT